MLAFFHILPGTGTWYSDLVVDLIVLFDVCGVSYFFWQIRKDYRAWKAAWIEYYRENPDVL